MTAPARWLAIGLAIVALAIGAAAAQPRPAPGKVTVALLPLDAEARLALYGQPVAAEVARALAAEGLDVRVVGQGDPVPTGAVLVIDGTLRKSGGAIKLALSVRDPARATVLATVTSTAASLIKIDAAAADVAGKLVPEVRKELAARSRLPERTPPVDPGGAGSGSAAGSAAVTPPPVPPRIALPPSILLVASSRIALDGSQEAMVAAIVPAFERLIDAAGHRPVPPRTLAGNDGKAIAAETAALGAAVGISIDVLALELDPGVIPRGRARARIRIVQPDGRAVFDRVVTTDTVVGRRGELAGHIAGYGGVQLADVMRVRVTRAIAKAP